MPTTSRRATPASIAHHVEALPPGTRLAEFEVVALLGVGGFGMVYQAFDHTLRRFVAIKEYMPAALAGRADGQSLWVRSSSDEQSFQAGLASFVDEARLLARFDHPGLVKVLRFWEANHTAYMVMPLYRGMTLKQARAHMRTPPPEAWLRSLLWSLASALQVLHEGQTLHRDISPDNIFLQDQGPPVLLDLGAARHAVGGSRDKHAAVLKVNYAPIEQYTNAAAELEQGPWSDLYALGAMVHGCLCNDRPLPATQRAVRDRMLPFARVAHSVGRQFGVEYSRPFVDAITQCLALQPQNRPQSVAAFLRLMDMTSAPAGLDAFDFRAQLGGCWVEPQDKNDPGVALPMLPAMASQSQSGVHSEAQPVPCPPPGSQTGGAPASRGQKAVVEPPGAQAPARGHTGRRRREVRAHRAAPVAAPAATPPRPVASGPALALRVMAGSAALLVMAAGLWWSGKERPRRQTPDSEIITELAEPVRPAPPASAPPAVQGGQVRAEARVEVPAGSALVPTPARDLRLAASVQGLRLEQAAMPPLATPAAAPVIQPWAPPAGPALAPASTPPSAQLALRPAPSARVADPLAACAEAGFLTRPMCIQRECRKAALVSHPICVGERNRLEEQERRQQYAQ